MPVSEQGAVASTFTKGPWEAVPTEYDNEYDIVSYAAEPGIAVAQHVSGQNMSAIAALPELIEALNRLSTECKLEGLKQKAGFDCWISLADKALAKARGL